jgi:hypothetical protein
MLAFVAGLRTLRRLNGATALGHVLAAVIALTQSLTVGNTVSQPWLLVAAGPLMAAVIFFGPSVQSLLGTLIAYAILEFPRPDNTEAYAYLRATFDIQMVTVAVLGGLVAVTMYFSRRLDDVAAESASLVEEAANARARAEVSTIAAAITHDNILSTLLFGAVNNPIFRSAVATQAEKALEEIESLTAVTAGEDGWEIFDFWQRLELIATTIAPDALIVRPQVSLGSVPTVVAEAFFVATTQALRNSVMHADSPGLLVRRVVTLAGTSRSLEVRIQDNGVGFDVADVPDSRRGIKTSITGRMGAIPGGKSVVESQPGLGATVRLMWNLDATKTGPALTNHDLLSADILSHRLAWILAGIFVLGQGALFLASTINGGNVVASFVALIALCIPVFAVSRNQFFPRPLSSLAVLAGAVVAAAMVFFQNFSEPVFRQDFWFLTGCAFLLLWLLRSNRSWWAWAGMGVMVAMTVAAAVSQQASAAAAIDMVMRPLVILLVGTICSVAVKRLQSQISRVRAEATLTLEAESFTVASSRQRHVEAVRLREQSGATLELLAKGRELTLEQARECAALEGTLRDEVVGGRLSRQTIAVAAARARRLGVDVALIDDRPGVSIADAAMVRIEQWMTESLATLDSGRFVGRIPPEGSLELATIVVTDSDGPRRISLR